MAAKGKRDVVITSPLETNSHVPFIPVEGHVIGQRMHALSASQPQGARKSVYEGILWKRCRLCWRERIVEVIRDTADYSGMKTSYHLLIFDPRKRTLKDRIAVDDIVTIRASCDCYFQIFLSDGKILQFRADGMENQAYWMALIKVGLGRGSIFHVRVHTAQRGLEHALLYSIGVNLPAHRVGQLDRILVLASPINDINIHAWDLNRVKHFMRLDIGVQMELCSSCTTSRSQGTSITFILDKLFHNECIAFLCREAHISDEPVKENSLMMYPVEHTCAQRQTTPTDHIINHSPPSYQESLKQEIRHKQQFGECRNYRDGPPQLPPRDNLYTTRPSCGLSTRDISRKAEAPFTSTRNTDSNSEAGRSEIDSVPPRNMTRKNFETAMPAMSHPYANFQPHLFQQSSSSYESPYQISSRIIITDSGEVQYERNILGNKPQHHGGFHFKQNIPLPPRKSAAATASRKGQSVSPKIFPRSLNRNAGHTQSCRPSAWGPQKTKPRLEKRASELSDSDDTYVFIPDVVKDPTKSPIPSDPLQNCADPLLCPPVGDSHLLMPTMGGVSQSTDNLMGTDSISLSSENYDDVITVSQQVHLKHSDGSLLHVLATQEVVSNSSILVPESDQPPGQPIRSNSPQKPAIKPRRRKPSSESEVKLPNDTSSPAFTVSSGQKSSTIPNPTLQLI